MKFFRRLSLLILAIAVGGVLTIGAVFYRSLPQRDGRVELPGLAATVTVRADALGIPVIQAGSRVDAIRALGYLTARDRLFQMDLMRRKNAGRLAELFGPLAVASDIKIRSYGFPRVAEAVAARLPDAHRQLLAAYAEGVNQFIEHSTLPVEFTVLGYRPEPWRIQDSVLVVLGMYEMLTAEAERDERMLTVMTQVLPPEVVMFLTPDTDYFTDRLQGVDAARRPARPVPVAELAALLKQAPLHAQTDIVQLTKNVAGSNAWAVGGVKTADGRALLASDMHVSLAVPNLWYRAELHYGDVHGAGLVLPGIPTLIAGSNGKLAWANTSLSGDFLDLVGLELNPADNLQYRLGGRWQNFEVAIETIAVKDAAAIQLAVKRSVWGPVATEPLLGKPVALHWLALDEQVFNFDLLDMQEARSLPEALDIANRAAAPPLNFMLADDLGHIAWTILGKIPKRVGGDGLISRSWADGAVGWDGYVAAQDLPRVVNPPEGYLVSANDRRIGKDYPEIIGHHFEHGYRAYRITQRLQHLPAFNEATMFALQLDTESEFYAFYQQLALAVLTPNVAQSAAELQDLRAALLAWNGRADKDSIGLPVLVEFRKQLAASVFAPFLATCRQLEPGFYYDWRYADTPLLALLNAKIPALLPDAGHFADWDAFILAQLKISAARVKAQASTPTLTGSTWGIINRAQIGHPFSMVLPLLSHWLDMPNQPLAGCDFCVRFIKPAFGASERMVVSPAHLDAALLHMPGGQSGHPASPNYRDQHAYWADGLPLPLLSGKSEHVLILTPTVDRPSQ